MRPISLKIKGLNSFNEEQFIDFERLTEEGFFGIFGPTGSGKSTVLDGITLALYGDISRKSTNFINTNCDTLSLSYTFQISGTSAKRYVVDREYKRNKKTGNPQSGKCKVVDITSGEPVVLADKVTEVTEACKDIIGLSLEDFTRTVVLPQGKFSEFLKLEGKPRRDMLERLFNLQKYGDNLSMRLKSEKYKEESNNSELLGELRGYDDISEESLKAKEEEFQLAANNLISASGEFKLIDKLFKEKQELWNLSVELKEYEENKKKLQGSSEEILDHKKRVKLGESASKVAPYIENYEATLKSLDISKENKDKLKVDYENLKLEKEDVEKNFNLWREKKDKELPLLKVKEEKIKDALIEQNNLGVLKKDINKLKKTIENLEENEKKSQEEINVFGERILKGGNVVKETEEKFEALHIDNDLKEKVQKGIRLNERYIDLQSLMEKNKSNLEKLKKSIADGQLKEKQEVEKFNKKIVTLKVEKDKLETLMKACPGEQTDLLILQRKLSEGREKWLRYETASKDIEDAKKSIENLKGDIKKNQEEKKHLEDAISVLKNKITEQQVETLAYKLRESLNRGEACPVCGSVHHQEENLKHIVTVDLSEVEGELSQGEKCLKRVEKSITTGETQLLTLEERVKKEEEEIKNLGEDFKTITTTELQKKFDNLSGDLDKFVKSKELLENSIKTLNEERLSLEGEINTIKSIILENEKQVKGVEEEYNKNKLSIDEKVIEIKELKDATGVDNFLEKNQEILKIESEREELQKSIKKYRSYLEEFINKKDELQLGLNALREKLAKEKSSLTGKEKNAEEKSLLIKSKVGDEKDLDSALKDVEENIKVIETSFSTCEKNKEIIEESFKVCNEALIEVNSKISEMEKRIILEKKSLENILSTEAFESIEEVKANSISKEKIETLKKLVDEYNHNLSKISGAIESLLKKINGREITEEQWLKIQEDRIAIEEQVKSVNEIKIKVEEEVNFIKRKLLELKDLLVKKEKLQHKLALLDDLEKLFKGKRFVEFVASNRLKYVSLEASKKLKEITGGNYGLEVDENTKFIIRDYKNGGAARDASTLSGGETFLTSLALALALSTEIQLKGTAPLELFFLDEGFGTLDDDLLEVVMSSLERIHNDRLKIGIISHVETIKNRVPVKLIITPAEAGKGGSKVKIEKS